MFNIPWYQGPVDILEFFSDCTQLYYRSRDQKGPSFFLVVSHKGKARDTSYCTRKARTSRVIEITKITMLIQSSYIIQLIGVGVAREREATQKVGAV